MLSWLPRARAGTLRAYAAMLAVGMALLLAGCAVQPVGEPAAPMPSAQDLPLLANIKSGPHVVLLEVARTPAQQDIGLMFRTDLPADRGMLFPMDPPRVASFWMKDTLIPLDIVFLRNGVVTKVDANVPVCTADPCESYSSGTPVDQVIELSAGRAAELGIAPGQALEVNSN